MSNGKVFSPMSQTWRNERRSVMDIPEWPGWEPFMEYYKAAEDAPYPEDSKLYFATIFELGCRGSEAITIKPSQFKWNDEAISVNTVTVLKKKKKMSRNILILLENNPIAHDLIDMVENCDTEYLLTARQRFTRRIIPDSHTTRATVYNRISEIHEDLFPHGIRGYRASHLVHERDFSVQDLVKWFEWKSADMAIHYTRTKDIAKAMGIKEIPR